MTIRLCPACAEAFKLTTRGLLARHGFSAINVRHGDNSGHHTGSCAGSGNFPIGTEKGNEAATSFAASYRAHATKLEGLPAITVEEASADAIREARQGMTRRNQNIQGYLTADDFKATSYRGWFSEASLSNRREGLQRRREAVIAGLRATATALDEAVASFAN